MKETMMKHMPQKDNFKKKGMSTKAKVMIGVGVLAVTGAAAYVVIKKPVWNRLVV